MHYIAGISTGKWGVGGKFKFYNTGIVDKNGKSINNKKITINQLLEYFKGDNAIPILLIGVAIKRGRW